MSRNLNKATPWVKTFFLKLQSEVLRQLGIKIIPVNVDRTVQVQFAFYAQGRKVLAKVNALRKKVGLNSITEQENKKKITWTLVSDHITDLYDEDETNDLSRAVDIGIIDERGKYQGNDKADVNKDNKPDYIQIGAIAKTIAPDVDWGGDWKKTKDYPHYAQPKHTNPV